MAFFSIFYLDQQLNLCDVHRIRVVVDRLKLLNLMEHYSSTDACLNKQKRQKKYIILQSYQLSI